MTPLLNGTKELTCTSGQRVCLGSYSTKAYIFNGDKVLNWNVFNLYKHILFTENVWNLTKMSEAKHKHISETEIKD